MTATGTAVASRRSLKEGWPVAAGIVSLLVLASVAVLASFGVTETGLRLVIRMTGRVSTALFATAFAASAAHLLLRTRVTAWLRRNRRYVGLAFAGSQAIHLLALIGFARASTEFREDVSPETLVVGGIAYGFTFLMAATSFDAAVRWLGPRWRTLHLVGGWWIFAVLLLTVFPVPSAGPVSLLLSVALFSTLGLRIAAWRRRRTLALSSNH